MTTTRQYYLARERHRPWLSRAAGRHFGLCCAIADFALIVLIGAAAGYGWHAVIHRGDIGAELYLSFAILVAAAYTVTATSGGAYDLRTQLSGRRGAVDTSRNWLIAFFAVISVSFLFKNVEQFSRGSTALLFGFGLGALLLRETIARRLLASGRQSGALEWRRVLLVGMRHDISNFLGRFRPGQKGLAIVGTVELDAPRGGGDTEQGWSMAKLREAVHAARYVLPDDVYLVTSWSENALIDTAMAELAAVPASIHLAPEAVMTRFPEPRIGGLYGLPTLELCRPPLGLCARMAKRAFDIAGALAGLILLAPLFAVVALLIKLDSPGPVLFTQTRYGYNQRPFRILKFRSMSVTEDGADVRAATPGDARVTRFGHWLRRTNIDELPQLVNVLKGDMSLIGPRPHAMVHDQAYMAQILAYARRNNVKPGITGWAQVNGLRGGTEDIQHIRQRVALDFWYLENWSLELDFEILLRTLFSRKAYVNAY